MQDVPALCEAHHYFVGLTQQSATGGLARLCAHGSAPLRACDVYPVGGRFHEFTRPMRELLDADANVRETVLRPILGRYGISRELSVGLEVHAREAFNAAALAATVFRQALNAGQIDAFVGRVLAADEWTDNSRPGLTVLFKRPQRLSSLNGLLHRIAEFPGDGWPIDGFSTIPSNQSCLGSALGLRYVFLPEISIRWDLTLRAQLSQDMDEIDIILLDQATKIGRLCRSLVQDPMIAEARLNWFDVMVAGIEDYQDTIDALAKEREVRKACAKSMSRKPFSEILALTNATVLQKRLTAFESRITSPTLEPLASCTNKQDALRYG